MNLGLFYYHAALNHSSSSADYSQTGEYSQHIGQFLYSGPATERFTTQESLSDA